MEVALVNDAGGYVRALDPWASGEATGSKLQGTTPQASWRSGSCLRGSGGVEGESEVCLHPCVRYRCGCSEARSFPVPRILESREVLNGGRISRAWCLLNPSS